MQLSGVNDLVHFGRIGVALVHGLCGVGAQTANHR
jgi:hypothetical protein